jgi:hypothetical protein
MVSPPKAGCKNIAAFAVGVSLGVLSPFALQWIRRGRDGKARPMAKDVGQEGGRPPAT